MIDWRYNLNRVTRTYFIAQDLVACNANEKEHVSDPHYYLSLTRELHETELFIYTFISIQPQIGVNIAE